MSLVPLHSLAYGLVHNNLFHANMDFQTQGKLSRILGILRRMKGDMALWWKKSFRINRLTRIRNLLRTINRIRRPAWIPGMGTVCPRTRHCKARVKRPFPVQKTKELRKGELKVLSPQLLDYISQLFQS
ncbi:hypothetical protein HMPREF0322_01455 [Desulfitobacterium hafniense DP7]|uniref:Uncharacterized protein n=1 Tax=Desulfitobacterium hafniense DP7 TaxID=537010 RepID=G9XKH2_DESHA|nr:hypothetical protein HMPREF0322_01455 [Desulfitobacterium hafniense DP7]